MKICWDNLEKLEYRPDRDEWQDKKWKSHFYIYKDACKNCSEPFLAHKRSGPSVFCDHFCSMYGRKHTEETKKKIQEAHEGKVFSEKHKRKLCESHNDVSGENNPNYKGGVIEKNITLYDTYAYQINFCEKIRRNGQNTDLLEVKCAYCGKWHIPIRSSIQNRIQALNGKGTGENRLYCSENCKQECPIYRKQKYQVGHPKSNKNQYSREVQPELRQMCFERDDFTCQKCGKHQDELDVGLQCHHIEGIRWEPLESADLDKVMTLCKNCHKEIHKQPDCGYHDMRCPE